MQKLIEEAKKACPSITNDQDFTTALIENRDDLTAQLNDKLDNEFA